MFKCAKCGYIHWVDELPDRCPSCGGTSDAFARLSDDAAAAVEESLFENEVLVDVVVEAAKRSGSRITARLGLEQGREVYAVPGPGEGESFKGCDELMEQGARSVTSAGEVILDLAALIKADARRMRVAREAAPPRQLFLDLDAPEGAADDVSDAESAVASARAVERSRGPRPAAPEDTMRAAEDGPSDSAPDAAPRRAPAGWASTSASATPGR